MGLLEIKMMYCRNLLALVCLLLVSSVNAAYQYDNNMLLYKYHNIESGKVKKAINDNNILIDSSSSSGSINNEILINKSYINKLTFKPGELMGFNGSVRLKKESKLTHSDIKIKYNITGHGSYASTGEYNITSNFNFRFSPIAPNILGQYSISMHAESTTGKRSNTITYNFNVSNSVISNRSPTILSLKHVSGQIVGGSRIRFKVKAKDIDEIPDLSGLTFSWSTNVGSFTNATSVTSDGIQYIELMIPSNAIGAINVHVSATDSDGNGSISKYINLIITNNPLNAAPSIRNVKPVGNLIVITRGKTSRISGNILDPDSPMSNINVDIYDEFKLGTFSKVLPMKTDSSGDFEIDFIAPYKIKRKKSKIYIVASDEDGSSIPHVIKVLYINNSPKMAEVVDIQHINVVPLYPEVVDITTTEGEAEDAGLIIETQDLGDTY